MTLIINVLHNPGTTYSVSELNGFTELLVSTHVNKTLKNVINRTSNGKYLIGSFFDLNEGGMSIIIPFKDFKEGFDLSGQYSIFKCYVKSSVLMYHSIGDSFKMGVKVNLGEAVYDIEDALDQIKERGTLHSVYVNLNDK